MLFDLIPDKSTYQYGISGAKSLTSLKRNVSRAEERRETAVFEGYFHVRSTHLNMHLCCCCFFFVTASFRAGKANVATESTRLFACQNISFATPFYGGEEITVLATVGRSIKSPTRGNGGAIWVESVDNSGFKACILEYSDGSNNTAEVNWIAIQSAPSGAKKGTATLNDWSTGTTCKWINLQQVTLLLLCNYF